MLKENIVQYFEDSLRNNWGEFALSNYKGIGLRYKDVAEQILKLHLIFELNGIERGDKVAQIGKNSVNWGIVFLATLTYGAVAVPILPDFIPEDIQEIIKHSDSKILFSSDLIFETLDFNKMLELKSVFSLESFSILESRNDSMLESINKLEDGFKIKYDTGIIKETVKFPSISNNELAIISYTSGTTGHSKGVMISHNSLSANIRFARNNMPLKSGDKILSFLPLAHAYGLAFEFLFPFSIGCHITFLTKTPSPQIITEAFSVIKPRLILSVPLIIEKIYRKSLLPSISKPSINFLLKVPLLNQLLYKKINKKLSMVFGGNFQEVVIGGAPLNAEAEAFFKKIKFPFTIGYGMTECGPLISYSSWKNQVQHSAGKAVDTLKVKIDSENQELYVGEILIKGDNVMDGYYKNEEATNLAIDSEGWLHTGDLGLIDKEGNIFIKGRNKSMILGASGQNIYPEEIESIIDNMYGILESLVIEEDRKLIALICPDKEALEKHKINTNAFNKLLDDYLISLNKRMPAYMRVNKFIIHEDEFIKTPKRSIKRFLYLRNN